MDFGVVNLGVLVGLVAVGIPPLLHLLRRRRGEIVDWGAMQFLPSGSAQQRRRLLDELLLLAVRMAVVALLVLALASPYAVSPWLARLGDDAARDVVLVVDGSYSMEAHLGDAQSPGAAARAWAHEFVANLGSGDRLAIVVARRPPRAAQELLPHVRRELTTDVDLLPAPRGNPDLPAAVGVAWQLLVDKGTAPRRQMFVLTDRQHHGLADARALERWEALGDRLRSDVDRLRAAGEVLPALQIVDVAPPAAAAANFALAPLHTTRGLALTGDKVEFRSAVVLHGFTGPARPRRLSYAVDDVPAGDVAVDAAASAGRIPLAFAHRFTTAGSHLVSVRLDAEPGTDCLSVDNEQHIVVDVHEELPVLLVDGARELSRESSTFFLQSVLTRDQPLRRPRVVTSTELKPDDLGPNLAVVMLCDVPELTAAQGEALDRFIARGGSALVVLGARVESSLAWYNEQLYRQGQHWLPARLVEAAHDRSDPPRLEPKSLTHSALSLLAKDEQGSLGQVRFPRWWKVAAEGDAPAVPLGLLTNGDPLLLEKRYGEGRVVLCTAPLDRSWESSLPSTWEYPVLVHELVSHLAGVRAAVSHGSPGSRLGLLGSRIDLSFNMVLQGPEGRQTVRVDGFNFLDPVHTDTGAIGVYHARAEQRSETSYYVVPPDLDESDLRRASDADLAGVLDLLPRAVRPAEVDAGLRPRQRLWWLFLLGVMVLLCYEVWLTCRLVRGRAGG